MRQHRSKGLRIFKIEPSWFLSAHFRDATISKSRFPAASLLCIHTRKIPAPRKALFVMGGSMLDSHMSLVSQIFSGLRFRLLLLVIITCIPLVVLMLHTAGDERRRQVANWEQRSEKLLGLAEEEESVILGGTKQLLMAVAESSAVNSGNQRSCKKLLDELFASYPRYANLGVINTNGELIASALPLKNSGHPTDGWVFRRTLETHAFAVGEFPS